MIKVRLFGLMRLDSGIKEINIEADSVDKLFAQLSLHSDKLSIERLSRCVIMINGVQCRRKSVLKDGDEVMLLSPVAGG